MKEHTSSIAVFIDYDNLSNTQKENGVLDIVNNILFRIPLDESVSRLKCEVRVYGGWYEGSNMTELAQDVSAKIKQDFPAVLQRQNKNICNISITINADLALSMLEDPSHHLFYTFRRREGRPHIRMNSNINCDRQDCPIPQIKKFLNAGNCPKKECLNKKLAYKAEQKMVDTMLTCDLIYAPHIGHNMIIIVSSDDDFLPPLRTILLRGILTIRFHPKKNCRRPDFPKSKIELIEEYL